MLADLRSTVQLLVKVLTNTPVPEKIMKCLENNSEGSYHRKAANFTRQDILTSDQEMMLSIVKQKINSEISSCIKNGNCVEIA